jgi:hypothetical protein
MLLNPYMKNPHEKPKTIFYLNYLLKSHKPRKKLFFNLNNLLRVLATFI